MGPNIRKNKLSLPRGEERGVVFVLVTQYGTLKKVRETPDWIYPRIFRSEVYLKSLEYKRTLAKVIVVPGVNTGCADEGDEMIQDHTMSRIPETDDPWICVAAQDGGTTYLTHVRMENKIRSFF